MELLMRWMCSVDKRGLESRIYYCKVRFGLWNKSMASIIAAVGTCPLGIKGILVLATWPALVKNHS